MSKQWLLALAACCALLGAPLGAAPQDTAPAAFHFVHPEAKETWREGLPQDCVAVSPTCVYSPSERTVFALAELCGLGEGYEVEFLLLGNLSDRAYEGLAIAWDAPSVIGKAVAALGVPKGVEALFRKWHSEASHAILGIVAASTLLIFPVELLQSPTQILIGLLFVIGGAVVSYALSCLCDRLQQGQE